MTLAEAPPEPRQSIAVLSGLRRRLRRLAVQKGTIATAWVAVLAISLSFLLDWSLVLPVPVRLVLLLLSGGAIVHTLARKVLDPLSRALPDADLAKLLESSHPELRQSLITAIELSRPGSETAAHVSQSLIAAVVRSAEEGVAKVDPRRVIDDAPLRRQVAFLATASIFLVGLAAYRSDLASLWLRRNLLLAGDLWPKDVELELVIPRIPAVVAVGDPVEVVVRAQRGSPSSVTVSSWEEGRAPLRADSLSETTSRTYRKVFEDVARPFHFRIRGGDDEIGPFDVDVRLRPRIDMQSIRMWCEYPGYTGIGPTPEGEPLRHGNLKVPTGTRVRFQMASNVPILAAHLVFVAAASDAKAPEGSSKPGSPYAGGEPHAQESEEVWPAPGAVKLELEDDHRFRGELTALESGQYYFQLEASDGFRSRRPDRFRIEAVPDRKPAVRILEPQRLTEEVSADARVRIRVEASDDHGIEKGVIEGQYFAPGSDAGRSQSIPLPGLVAAPGNPADDPDAGEGRRERTKTTQDSIVLEISKLDTGGPPPAPGSRFQFMALASDQGGNIGESTTHLVQIVEKEDLVKALTDQLMLIRDQLREAGRRQKSARKDLDDLQRELGLKALSGPESQKLYRHRQNQERVSQALARELEELERIISRTQANSIDDEKWLAWVQGVRDDVHELARRKSPDIEKGLDALRAAASREAQEAASLAPLTAGQKDVEKELHDIDLRLTEFGDLSALLQGLREIRRRQLELRDDVRKRMEGGGAAPPKPKSIEEPNG